VQDFFKLPAVEQTSKWIGDSQVEQIDVGLLQPLFVRTKDLGALSKQDFKSVV